MKCRRLLICLIIGCFALSPIASVQIQLTRAQQPVPPTPPSAGTITLPDKNHPSESSTAAPDIPPPNDDFNSAAIVGILPFYGSSNTAQATVAADDPNMGCGAGVNSNTVWYRFTPTFTGRVYVDTYNSAYDTVLAVFTGNRGALNRVTCNDDAIGTTQSEVEFVAIAYQPYYLEVADYGAPGGGQLYLRVTAASQGITDTYVGTYVAPDGQFVIGTTGGDPGIATDDNKPLLYGYPSNIWSSFTTLRMNSGGITSDYPLGVSLAPSNGPTVNGDEIVTMWNVNGIRVTQRLYFAVNPDTGRNDTTAIEYQLTNTSTTVRQAGIRILLDTMIGANDGAPLFAPGWGSVTTEQDSWGRNIPDYWIAWESPTFDPSLLKAKGHLNGANLTLPNRVIMAYWPLAKASTWDYTVNPGNSITSDSSVLLYYFPTTINPGQTRTIRTLYGLTLASGALQLTSDVTGLLVQSRQNIQEISNDASEVGIVGNYFLDKLSTDKAARVINLVFNAMDLLPNVANWSLVSRGLNHVATPGYKAALHASWQGWAEKGLEKHWYKLIYDIYQNNREVLFRELAKTGLAYYTRETLEEIGQDALQTWALDKFVAGQDDPYHDYLVVPIQAMVDAYWTELQREQNQMLAGLAGLTLTADQIQAYRADLAARQQANSFIAGRLSDHHSILWDNYQKALADEHNWLKFLAPLFAKWIVIGGATLLWDGPGFYIASIGTAAVQTIVDLEMDTQAINHDQQMHDQSFRYLTDRVSLGVGQIAFNAVAGLNLIRAGDAPIIPAANVNVSAMRSYGECGTVVGPMGQVVWFGYETKSEIELTINNPNEAEATYLTYASYRATAQGDEVLMLPEGQTVEIGQTSATAVIPFKAEKWGVSPDEGDLIDIVVLGATETGIYKVASLTVTWSPQQIGNWCLKTGGDQPFDGYSPQDVPVVPYPLVSFVTLPPNSNDYEVTIAIQNPFTSTVMATTTQVIPTNYVVIDAGGAQVVGNTLSWSETLEAGAGTRHQVVVSWTGWPAPPLAVPGPNLRFLFAGASVDNAYDAPESPVPPAWSLTSTVQVPMEWRIGQSFNISTTLHNISVTSVQGTLTVTMQAADGTTLWSTNKPINLASDEVEIFSVNQLTPARMGLVLVTVNLTVGTTTRTVAQEVVNIRGYEVYQPLIRMEGY